MRPEDIKTVRMLAPITRRRVSETNETFTRPASLSAELDRVIDGIVVTDGRRWLVATADEVARAMRPRGLSGWLRGILGI